MTAATVVSASDSSSLVPASRAFFEQDVVALARALLGQRLVRRLGRALLVGRIVETEAYGGEGLDPSAHSFRGPTPRCAVMFGPAGHAYVYTTHQGRCCLNVTATGDRGGKAVLIRALEPLAGIERMRAHRLAGLADGPTSARLLSGAARDHELARGPARLCQCLAIDRTLNGVDFTDARSPLFVATGEPELEVRWTVRVGLNAQSASCGWHWRVVAARSRAVSAGARSARGARRAPRPARCPD